MPGEEPLAYFLTVTPCSTVLTRARAASKSSCVRRTVNPMASTVTAFAAAIWRSIPNVTVGETVSQAWLTEGLLTPPHDGMKNDVFPSGLKSIFGAESIVSLKTGSRERWG